MFVPVDQQYAAQFIQHQFLREHIAAFADPRNYLSWGHLLFSDQTAVAVGKTRHIVLVRDPYDWVLARARFFVSNEFQGADLLTDGTLRAEAILNMMILGIPEKAPPLQTLFTYNALAWLGMGALLQKCGIERPDDWRERVRIGSDPKQSGTARENLTGITTTFPDELPAYQKELVDYSAPGLRRMLGYT
jgi:hypothetical protein